VKKIFNKTKGIIKGAPIAVLISAAIHGLLLLAAVGFVVFTIIDKPQQQFVPVQKIDRPKMKLKKLRVKVKQNSKPKSSTQRIISKTTKAMPDIQLPEMSGVGGGLGESIGGFDLMDDMKNMSMMGLTKSIGNDLEGTFIDFSRLRSGTVNSRFPPNSFNEEAIYKVCREYVAEDWNVAVFSKFYQASTKLYATQFMVPTVSSRIGPAHFGVSDKFRSQDWAILYKGKIGRPEGGRFRFWGVGDCVFIIRVNGEWVFDGSWGPERQAFLDYEREDPSVNRKHSLGSHVARVGSWFTLEPGEPTDMELLISEGRGGDFLMMLLVQEEGVDYPENEHGAPILPMFKMTAVPNHLIDEIEYLTVPDRMDIAGGPIFGAY